MVIVRKDQHINLTNAEIYQAYTEVKQNYIYEDIKMHWEREYNEEFPYDDTVLAQLAERIGNIKNKNDSYWEYYWAMFDLAFKELKEGSN